MSGNAQWSGDEVATLQRLAADGVSAGGIAAVMGRTRNAVLGKCHRMKLPIEAKPKPRQPQPKPIPAHARFNSAPGPRALAVDTPVIVAAEAPPGGVRFLAAGRLQCRWIVGDGRGADARVCGCPVRGESSWCATHHRVVFMRRAGVEAAA